MPLSFLWVLNSALFNAALEMNVAAVQAALQTCVQQAMDVCRLEALLPAFRSGSASAEAAELPPVDSAVQWPRVQLLMLPGLQLQMQAGATTDASRKESSRGRAQASGDADFTCRTLLQLAHAYRAHVDTQGKSFDASASSHSTAADSSAAAIAAPTNSKRPLAVDVNALLTSWGNILKTRLAAALQQDDSSGAELLTDVRVEATRGYLNFTLSEAHRLRMLEAERHAATEVASPSFGALPTYMSPIGIWRSVFKEKFGTPRQGAVVPFARGRLTVDARMGAASLEGLSEYSHVWLLFVFHQNGNPAPFSCAKVAPPRLAGRRIGLFATRTPHRPNPLGLSLAKLDRVEGSTVHVSGVDLVDGTPVVDLKPYHPADCVTGHTVPRWLDELPECTLQVQWTPAALLQLTAACSTTALGTGGLEFYGPSEVLLVRQLIESIVSADPRSVHSRHSHINGIFGVAVDRLDVVCRIRDEEQSKMEEDEDDDAREPEESKRAAAHATAASAASQSRPLPVALIIQVLLYPDGVKRPRMRTKEWLQGISSVEEPQSGSSH
jgi:tRNA-Thr(GGU) m(6)t(6)A37 methyltransferase TsaA